MRNNSYIINPRGEVVYRHTHQGRSYSYTLSGVRGTTARTGNQSTLKHDIRLKKAYIYHNAETAGVACLGGRKRKQLR